MGIIAERFTRHCKWMLNRALEETAQAGEPYITPERVLLSMMESPDLIVDAVLERMGVSPSQALQKLEPRFRDNGGEPIDKDKITLDPMMKRMLDLAYDEAKRDNSILIEVEHLLLGILRLKNGFAYEVLTHLGLDLVSARQEIKNYPGVDPEQVDPHKSYGLWKEAPPGYAELDSSSTSQSALSSDRTLEFTAVAPQMRYEVRKFDDPVEATTWLNIITRSGYHLRHASAANGELWIIVEGEAEE